MHRMLPNRFAAILVSLTVLSPAVWADLVDTNPASAESGLAEVIVTARRVQENVQNVPVAVTALSANVLREKSIVTLNDLQYNSPGLDIIPGFSAETLNVADRGQSASSAAKNLPSVQIYFADIALATAISTTLYDLNSVEVLRGPQGTLFGRNSTGGALLLEPARPDYRFGGYAQVQGGNYNDAEFDGALNVPLVADRLAVRIAANTADRGGYVTDVFNGDRFGWRRSRAYRISLLADPTDWLSNLTVYDVARVNSSPANIAIGLRNCNLATFSPPASCLYNFVPAAVGLYGTLTQAVNQQNAWGPYTINTNFNNENQIDSHIVSNITKASLGSLTLKNIFGYSSYRQFYGFSGFDLPQPILDVNKNSPYPAESANTVTNELQLLGKSFGERLDWITGAYYLHTYSPTIYGSSYNAFAPINPNNPNNIFAQSNDFSRALFAHTNYDLSDLLKDLSMSAGYRYTWDSRYENARATSYSAAAGKELCVEPTAFGDPNFANCQFQLHRNFSSPSWDISLQYKATDKTLVYLASRHSYKSGGFNPGAQGNPVAQSFLEYAPEHVTDFELGVKSDLSLLGMPSRVNADIYRGKYTGIQRVINFIDPASLKTAAATVNAATATIQGLELQATIFPVTSLELGVNYAYTNAKYDSFANPQTGANEAFNPLANAPRNQLSVSARYRLPLDVSLGELSASAEYFWQSKFYFSDFAYDVDVNAIAPGYHKVDVHLDWVNFAGVKNVDVRAFAKNVTDQKYIIGGNAFEGSLGLDWAQYGEPRMYGISLRYHW